jgi:hypothetical protein
MSTGENIFKSSIASITPNDIIQDYIKITNLQLKSGESLNSPITKTNDGFFNSNSSLAFSAMSPSSSQKSCKFSSSKQIQYVTESSKQQIPFPKSEEKIMNNFNRRGSYSKTQKYPNNINPQINTQLNFSKIKNYSSLTNKNNQERTPKNKQSKNDSKFKLTQVLNSNISTEFSTSQSTKHTFIEKTCTKEELINKLNGKILLLEREKKVCLFLLLFRNCLSKIIVYKMKLVHSEVLII